MRSFCQPLFHLAFLLSITLVVARQYPGHPLRARNLDTRDALLDEILYRRSLQPLWARDAYASISRGGGEAPYYDPVRNTYSPQPQSHAVAQQQSPPQSHAVDQQNSPPPSISLTPPSPPPPSNAQLPGERQSNSQPPVAGACSGGKHANCDPSMASVFGYKDTANGKAPLINCGDCGKMYPINGKRSLDVMLTELGYR
ncbi:hypothetical protein MMC10_006057 [Thelotrema lepadinum]|nr:hypothetical protein [Thelotrema lepadinum]